MGCNLFSIFSVLFPLSYYDKLSTFGIENSNLRKCLLWSHRIRFPALVLLGSLPPWQEAGFRAAPAPAQTLKKGCFLGSGPSPGKETSLSYC